MTEREGFAAAVAILEEQIAVLFSAPGAVLDRGRHESERVRRVKRMFRLGYFGYADAVDWEQYGDALTGACALDAQERRTQ